MRRKLAEFTEHGRRYVVRDPRFLRHADHVLWNDRMVVHANHRGQCDGYFLQPGPTGYALDQRLFYVRDDRTGRHWTAPFSPLEKPPQRYECSFGVGDTAWRVVNDGIELTLRLCVPRDHALELWTVGARNVSARRRSVSFFTYFPIGVRSWFSSAGCFDRRLGGLVSEYFPYYVKVQDYYARLKLKRLVFCIPERRPTAHEISLNQFHGMGVGLAPEGLRRRRLRGADLATVEPVGGVFQYALKLAPGRSWTGSFIFGPAQDRAEIRALKARYLAPGAPEKTLRRVYRFYEREYAPRVRIETPDTDLNHFINRWLPEEALRIGRTLRHSECASGRNAILDAAGALYTDPSLVRRWFPVIYGQQDEDGFMPHGIPLFEGVVPGGINTIRHRDVNVWGPPQLHFYIAETDDWNVLDLRVPWKTSKRTSTLYEHVCRGMEWQLRDRSGRGLSRIGEGDWNDPLNMAGWKGKGESVWLTQALIWALDQWAEIVERRGDARLATRYRREAQAMRKAVNRLAWDGKWYARGTTDAGRWFGSKANDEGRIYLNPQGWAMISGTARAARIERCIRSVRRHLETPAGNLMLWPPYTRMHEDIGKLTVKRAGMEENGSVYNHAQLFYAQGLYAARRADEAFRALRVALPGYGRNTVRRAEQIPIYIVNYFRGPAAGRSAGRSSHEAHTGSAPWFHRLAVGMLLGVQGHFDGLKLDPQLPSHWRGAAVWRRIKGAEFDIEIRRRRGVRRLTVLLDGRSLKGQIVPPQARGSRHRVTALIPPAT